MPNFFHPFFAGDIGDTGDMRNLKTYTNISLKPKCAELLTRVPLFLGFFALTLMTLEKCMCAQFFSDLPSQQFDSLIPGGFPFSRFFLLVTLVTPLIKVVIYIFFLAAYGTLAALAHTKIRQHVAGTSPGKGL